MNNKLTLSVILLSLGLYSGMSQCLTFVMRPGSDIVGSIQTATVMDGETFNDIGRRFDVGVYELMEANPGIDPRSPPSGVTVMIPTQYILPSGKRKGIVINLAELRLYYFHRDGVHVTTHPIGIGRPEWETPIASGKITAKTKDPVWTPPPSIRAWYEENNKELPPSIPPGPQNPLGKYAMRLSIPGYLIHGTNSPGGIGLRSSSGCIRMHPEDIESLFYKVSIGEEVRIINRPYKIGRQGNKIYLEAHEPLTGSYYQRYSRQELLQQAIAETPAASGRINRDLAKEAMDQSNGFPTIIE